MHKKQDLVYKKNSKIMSFNVGGSVLTSSMLSPDGMIFSKSINTNGLVCHFDAGNLNSYPGVGTTLTDLSGYGYNGTLSSAVIAYSIVGGTLYFNGSASVSFSNPLNQSNLVQVWTVATWVSVSNTSDAQYIISGLNNGVATAWYGGPPLLYLNGGANDYYTYAADVMPSGWHYIVYRFRNSDGTRTIWKDGVNFTGSGPNNTSTPSGQSGTFYLGGGLVGNIGVLQIYNRLLSDSEVIQNYYAQKTRFGL